MRWTFGILSIFAAMLLANGLLVYFAVKGAPQIEESYLDGER